MGFLSVVCTCGHVVDEHAHGFFRACEIDCCGCADFEASNEDEDEEETE